jgi:hypothetical protein
MQSGQHIINVLRADLSAATLKFEQGSQQININNILKSSESGFSKTYEFYTFAEPAENSEKFSRRLNRVKYVFDGEKNTLTRTIFYHQASGQGNERTNVLAEDVNHFELLAVMGDSHGTQRSFFRPFFQLVEKSRTSSDPAIREFMTTIIPEAFNSILTFKGYSRNLHSDPQ